jgi:hypothetical protein
MNRENCKGKFEGKTEYSWSMNRTSIIEGKHIQEITFNFEHFFPLRERIIFALDSEEIV